MQYIYQNEFQSISPQTWLDCNCIVTRGGVYDEILPEPEGFSEGSDQICKEIGIKDANKEMVRKEELEEAVAYADYK